MRERSRIALSMIVLAICAVGYTVNADTPIAGQPDGFRPISFFYLCVHPTYFRC